MRNSLTFLTSLALGALPLYTYAASLTEPLTDSDTGGFFGLFLRNIITFSSDVLIPFIVGIGFLVFVWGMFLYFIAGGANPQKQELGKQVLLYSVLGFVIIITFWGIINLISISTGLDDDDGTLPGMVPDIVVF